MKVTIADIHNFGPLKRLEIPIENNVTIITGPNDSGKTHILKAIYHGLAKTPINYDDVPYHKIFGSGDTWKEDPEIKVDFRILAEPHDFAQPARLSGNIKPGNDFVSSTQLAPKIARTSHIHFYNENRVASHRFSVPGRLPTPIFIDNNSSEMIRDTIPLDKPNRSELHLLKQVFGPNFTLTKLTEIPENRRDFTIDRYLDRFSKKFQQALPKSLKLSFKLKFQNTPTPSLSISIADELEELTPLSKRGMGVRRIVSLFATIAVQFREMEGDDYVILIDEPETSLHFDAQRSLKKLICDMANNDRIQVIYTTHSPAMIDNHYPSQIRVIKRHKRGDETVTSVIHNPGANAFYQVRSALGIIPSDSLLIGDITVIFEGYTEHVSLSHFVRKLNELGVKSTPNLLASSDTIQYYSSNGGDLEYSVRLVKSLNSKAIVLVDGDLSPKQKDKIKNVGADTYIEHPTGNEIEDCFDPQFYVDVLLEYLHHIDDERFDTLKDYSFDEFIDKRTGLNKTTLTNQVESWIKEKFPLSNKYSKTSVFKKCVEKLDKSDQLQLDHLDFIDELERAVKTHLSQ